MVDEEERERERKGERERERERETGAESEEGRRIGPTDWGNLINVNAAATAGATRRVWQSLICKSTLPAFLSSPFPHSPFFYSPLATPDTL